MSDYSDMPIRLKWFFAHWKGYVINREYLSERERYAALIFFKGLKQLDQEELTLLKEKYYTDRPAQANFITGISKTYLQYSDEVMAMKLDMSIRDYRMKRIKIEKKLEMILHKAKQEQKEYLSNQAEEFTLKTGRLYLKSFEVTLLGRILPDYILTQDGRQAKVFHKDDKLAKDFIYRLGMEKEPVKERKHDYDFDCVYQWK